jgi:septal ring factor EnvC (AmiA/AmiB activator)
VRQTEPSLAVAAAGSPDTTPFLPAQSGQSRSRSRVPRIVAWIAAGVFLIAAIALGVFALHQTSSANQWRHSDQEALAELTTAHASIGSLNSHVTNLNGEVSNLTSQLSAQASAKEKALDQNTVLSQLVAAEGTVSTELNTCVNDQNQFVTTLGNDVADGNFPDPILTDEANAADTDCLRAQTDNQSLQSAVSGAAG